MIVSPSEMDKLLTAVCSGNESAFTQFFNNEKSSLFRYCSRFMNDSDEARDIVQNTMIKVWTAASTISNPLHLRTWMYSVARNDSLMRIRKMAKRASLENEDSVWENDTPLSIMETDEERVIISKGLECLKSEYREVLYLCEFENMSYSEISEITGDSISAVKSRIFKARKALAKLLLKTTPHLHTEEKQ